MNREENPVLLGYAEALLARLQAAAKRGEPTVARMASDADALEYVLLALQPPSAWGPIETAPKDGTRFLGCDASRRYLALGYFDALGEFDEVDRSGSATGIGFYPTHWQPLPEPPSNTTRGGGVDG
jgi:hypothetical protein